MKYCRPTKHEFEMSWHSGNIVHQCQHCPCKKIAHGATKRYNEYVKDYGTKTAMKLAGF